MIQKYLSGATMQKCEVVDHMFETQDGDVSAQNEHGWRFSRPAEVTVTPHIRPTRPAPNWQHTSHLALRARVLRVAARHDMRRNHTPTPAVKIRV